MNVIEAEAMEQSTNIATHVATWMMAGGGSSRLGDSGEGQPNASRLRAMCRSVLVVVQVALVLMVSACLGYLAFKAMGYLRDRHAYSTLRVTYATSEAASAAAAADGVPVCPVDLTALTAASPAVVAWLVVDDLPDISYPIVHGQTNEQYLWADANGNPNGCGTPFLDYRNTSFDDDLHAIVYGHNMVDGSMFAPLEALMTPSTLSAPDAQGTFTIFTPIDTYRYQIFSVGIVSPDDVTYQVSFSTQQDFDQYVRALCQASRYELGIEATGQDHIVTLSTCTKGDRLVVSGRRV